MALRDELTDPWIRGGLLLLAVMTALTALVYRSAPQSVREVRTGVWSAARPEAAAPRLAQARDRLQRAEAAAEAGEDTLALRAYSEAASQASAAWELSRDDAESGAAAEVWSQATLEAADVLLRMGTGSGLRPDDNQLLEEALALTDRVLSAPTDSVVQQRAATLRARIQRQLRTGPLEWIPPLRR